MLFPSPAYMLQLTATRRQVQTCIASSHSQWHDLLHCKSLQNICREVANIITNETVFTPYIFLALYMPCDIVLHAGHKDQS